MNNIHFDSVNELISWIESQRRFSPKVSLEKMEYYLSLFDNPHKKFKSIHVTGTNGKGSVVSFLKTTLMEAGFNVATFTSPYIIKFNERICYNDEMISDNELLEISNLILSKYPIILENNYEYPSFFEFCTLIAFIFYSKLRNLDIAIIEVGMGGRLDSTNVITPLISVITNISLEHTNILGSTLEEIAKEKLGIVKPNSYLVTGNIDKTLYAVFESHCKNISSKWIKSLPREVEIVKKDIYSSQIILDNTKYEIGLSGSHQIENMICAYETLNLLKTIDQKWNLALSSEIYNRGFKKTKWQGRLEIVSENPLIIIDGCHNIDGINKVCTFINDLDYKYKRAVVSISSDKDKEEMLSSISKVFDEIIFTKYTYSRSASNKELYELTKHPNKKIIENVRDSIEYCKTNKCEFTLYLGSLYLASEVRNILKPLK